MHLQGQLWFYIIPVCQNLKVKNWHSNYKIQIFFGVYHDASLKIGTLITRLALAGCQVALGDKTCQNATETEFRGAILATDNLLTIHRHIYIK